MKDKTVNTSTSDFNTRAMRIVFLDRATIGGSVQLSVPNFKHEWIEYDRTTVEQVAARLVEADIAITNKVPIGVSELAVAANLKMISVAATGHDIINVQACRAHGVVVSNVRGYAVNTVPEHTFSLILALRRSIIAYRQDIKNGEWQRAKQFCFFNHQISDLHGSRLGIIGRGAIGRSVANIGKNAFGMDAVFLNHSGISDTAREADAFVSMDELLETSDVITLHCPLLASNQGMFGIEEFRKMKSTAIIINTARGGLIQEQALVDAIEKGLIGGAGIDVLSQEPPTDNHPFFKLLKRTNFILTPHIAWASTEAMQALWNQVIENIESYNANAPANVIT